MKIPVSRPAPARLSEATAQLRAIEDRAIFSNFGPLNTAFEKKMKEQMFGGLGECLTSCNATIALMLAIREALESRPKGRRRYALMPSFTFAAAAQAAQWNRLTPLYCDISPLDWSADPLAEERLLQKYGSEIAVVIPYATFGYDIDLSWYERIQRQYDIPVVVDAAASLGTISDNGLGFGAGFSGTVVYSMHVTKSFSTAEGGLIYASDPNRIKTLRTMSNFGFGLPRNATVLGLNAKMPEVAALLADMRLENFDAVMERRSQLVGQYRESLPEMAFQPVKEHRQAHQFTSALLPQDKAPYRSMIQTEMRQRGVDSATYFSPHVAEHEYFRDEAALARLPVTNNVASRVLTLPLYDSMTDDEVQEVVATLKATLSHVDKRRRSMPEAPERPRPIGLPTWTEKAPKPSVTAVSLPEDLRKLGT